MCVHVRVCVCVCARMHHIVGLRGCLMFMVVWCGVQSS